MSIQSIIGEVFTADKMAMILREGFMLTSEDGEINICKSVERSIPGVTIFKKHKHETFTRYYKIFETLDFSSFWKKYVEEQKITFKLIP